MRGRGLTALAGIAVALAWGGWLGATHLAGTGTPLDRLEAAFADMRFLLAGARKPPDSVVIVAIDDETIREAGRFPLPRATLADIVRRVSEAGAVAIGIDLLLVQPDPTGGDDALATALAGSKAVLAAAATFPPTGQGASDRANSGSLPTASDAIWPIAPLRAVAAPGFANVTSDLAGVPRHAPLLIVAEGAPHPSFALRLATLASGRDARFGENRVRIGTVASALDHGAQLPLRFYGPAGTIPTIGATRLTEPARLRGRVVLIGATALGSGDAFTTPFDPVLPGVEVLATALNHLLAGDGLVRDQNVRRVDAAAAIVLPILTVAFMSLRSPGFGAGLVILCLGAWAGAVILAFREGVWLSMALPIAATLPVALLYGVARRGLDTRQSRQLARRHRTLRQFQPPAIADRLEAEPRFLAEPIRQDAAVLFVDLTGFTGLSERIGPERTQDLLLVFHRIVDEKVGQQSGLVMTYMGDGAMAVFGVPEPGPHDARNALAAGMALGGDALDELAAVCAEASELKIKVGVHHGPLMLSRLGGGTHKHITPTGDTVNVASRLQEVAAAHGAAVACSEDAFARAGPLAGRDEFGPAREIPIRGRDRTVRLRLWPDPSSSLAPSSTPH